MTTQAVGGASAAAKPEMTASEATHVIVNKQIGSEMQKTLTKAISNMSAKIKENAEGKSS
jgi:hypothetical protein